MLLVDPKARTVTWANPDGSDPWGYNFIACSGEQLSTGGYGNVDVTARDISYYDSVEEAEEAGIWSLGQPHELNRPNVGRAVVRISEAATHQDMHEDAFDYVRSQIVWLPSLSPEEREDLEASISFGAFRRARPNAE